MAATDPQPSGQGGGNTDRPPPSSPPAEAPLPSNSKPISLACSCLNIVVDARGPDLLCQRLARGPGVFIKGKREQIWLPAEAETIVSLTPLRQLPLSRHQPQCTIADYRNTARWLHLSGLFHSIGIRAIPATRTTPRQRRRHLPTHRRRNPGESAGSAVFASTSPPTADRQTPLLSTNGWRSTLLTVSW